MFAMQINPRSAESVAVIYEHAQNSGTHLSQARFEIASNLERLFSKPIREVHVYEYDGQKGEFRKWDTAASPWRVAEDGTVRVSGGKDTIQVSPKSVAVDAVARHIGEAVAPSVVMEQLDASRVDERFYALQSYINDNGKKVNCHVRLYHEEGQSPVVIVSQLPGQDRSARINTGGVDRAILQQMEKRLGINPVEYRYIEHWPEGTRPNIAGEPNSDLYLEKKVFFENGKYCPLYCGELSKYDVQKLIGFHNVDVPELRNAGPSQALEGGPPPGTVGRQPNWADAQMPSGYRPEMPQPDKGPTR